MIPMLDLHPREGLARGSGAVWIGAALEEGERVCVGLRVAGTQTTEPSLVYRPAAAVSKVEWLRHSSSRRRVSLAALQGRGEDEAHRLAEDSEGCGDEYSRFLRRYVKDALHNDAHHLLLYP